MKGSLWIRSLGVVALALFDRIALQPDDILVDVLGLRPADRDGPALKHEVGHAGVGLLRLVDDGEAGIDALEQRLQGRTVAMLRRLPAIEFRADFLQVKIDVHAAPLLRRIDLGRRRFRRQGTPKLGR